MNLPKRIYLLTFIFVFFSGQGFALEEKMILQDIDRLREHVTQKNYDQAFRLIDQVKWNLYDLRVAKKKPEITGNTYINYYFKFQISNPIEEWEIKKLQVTDDIYKKKTRIMQNLVEIKNPSSPSGMVEQLIVSAYDIGHSWDAATVSDLHFKERPFIKKFAERQLGQQADEELIEKEWIQVEGRAAYRLITEIDLGYKEKVKTIRLHLYEKEGRFVLMVSFIMNAKNYPIYRPLFDIILNTLKIGENFDEALNVKKRSFMDIYLESTGAGK